MKTEPRKLFVSVLYHRIPLNSTLKNPQPEDEKLFVYSRSINFQVEAVIAVKKNIGVSVSFGSIDVSSGNKDNKLLIGNQYGFKDNVSYGNSNKYINTSINRISLFLGINYSFNYSIFNINFSMSPGIMKSTYDDFNATASLYSSSSPQVVLKEVRRTIYFKNNSELKAGLLSGITIAIFPQKRISPEFSARYLLATNDRISIEAMDENYNTGSPNVKYPIRQIKISPRGFFLGAGLAINLGKNVKQKK